MLNTEKMEKIIEKFGGDLNDIETNLESERLDYLLEEVNASSGYAPRHISFYEHPYSDISFELSQINGENLESLYYAFYYCDATDVKLNTKMPKLTTMKWMASSNTKLKTFEINAGGCSTLTEANNAFSGCSDLTKVVFKGFDFAVACDFTRFLSNCSKLTEVDLRCLGTTPSRLFSYMFYYCTALESLDLSNLYSTDKNIAINNMFQNCKALKHLDMRNFLFTYATSTSSAFSSVPVDCEIIVKDDEQRNALLAIKSDFTNIKTVAELG